MVFDIKLSVAFMRDWDGTIPLKSVIGNMHHPQNCNLPCLLIYLHMIVNEDDCDDEDELFFAT